MSKWKTPDVTPVSSGCVYHAFSVMRLTLGYKTGLPEELVGEDGLVDTDTMCEMAHKCFPNHHVMVIASNASGCFYGDYWDNYLLAFTFMPKGEEVGHIVIGAPEALGDKDVDLVFAVSLERKW